MALFTDVVTVVSPATTTPQVISVLGHDGTAFEPKLIFPIWAGATSDSPHRSVANGFGAALNRPLVAGLPVLGQGAISWSSLHGAPLATSRFSLESRQTALHAKLLVVTDPADGSVITSGQVTATAAGSFTLEWTSPVAGYEFYLMAVGGDTLTSYAITLHPKPLPATANDTVVFGFMPDMVMAGVSGDPAQVIIGGIGGAQSFGVAVRDPAAQWATGFTLDPSDNVEALRLQTTGRIIRYYGHNATRNLVIRGEASVSAWTNAGITLNWQTSVVAADQILFVAVKGGRYLAGSFSQVTANIGDADTPAPANIVTNMPFNRGLITASYGSTPSALPVNHARFSLGLASYARQGATWLGKRRLIFPAIAARDSSDGHSMIMASEENTGILTRASEWRTTDFSQANQIEGEWSYSDGFGRQVLFLAIGEAPTYTISGTLTGLQAGGTAVLQLNGGGDLTLTVNGPFSFTLEVEQDRDYAVTFISLPASQDCAITGGGNGDGTGIATAPVTDIVITCVDVSFRISGRVVGKVPGSTDLVIRNHNQVDTRIIANGPVVFVTSVLRGDMWSLAVQQAPVNPVHTVVISNASGTATADIADVVISLTAQYAPDDISDPIGHWPLQGDLLDQGAGNHPGTHPSPTFVEGRHSQRQAMVFNGTTDRVNLPGSAPTYNFVPQTQAFTVAAWVKKDSAVARGAIIGTTFARTANSFMFVAEHFGGRQSTLRMAVAGSTGSNALQIDLFSQVNAYTSTDWNHVAATFDGQGQTGTLYINGAPLVNVYDGAPQPLTTGAMSFDLALGAPSDPAETALLFLEGQLDDVRIYSRALNQAGIQAIMADTDELLVDPTLAADLVPQDIWGHESISVSPNIQRATGVSDSRLAPGTLVVWGTDGKLIPRPFGSRAPLMVVDRLPQGGIGNIDVYLPGATVSLLCPRRGQVVRTCMAPDQTLTTGSPLTCSDGGTVYASPSDVVAVCEEDRVCMPGYYTLIKVAVPS